MSSDLISREVAQKALYGCVMPNQHAEDILAEVPSANIIECARAMKEYCKERMKKPIWCNDCPLYEKVCFLFGNVPIPCKWDLPEGEKE